MTMFANDFLAAELRFFEKNRDEWCKQARGQYVVIASDQRIGGFYKTFDQAMAAAYAENLNEGEFLVEVVQASDAKEWVSHVAPGTTGD